MNAQYRSAVVSLLMLAASIVAPYSGAPATRGTPTLQLLVGGNWLVPVVYPENADPAIGAAAQELVDQLTRIAGSSPPLEFEGGQLGIKIGTFTDYPKAQGTLGFDPKVHEVVVVNDAESLYILGATPLRTEQAVWRFLATLGYRHYFAPPAWEIVPSLSDIDVRVSLRERPAFEYRQGIGSGGGLMDFATEPIDLWERRNGLKEERAVVSGHAWPSIVIANPEAFDRHPEYMSPDGKKLCVWETAVQEMAIDWAKGYLSARPWLETVSMAPSDGLTGWDYVCPSGETERLSPSDRMIELATIVLEALRGDPLYSDRRVAVQAYGATSPPPVKRAIDPDIVVAVMDGYLKDGLSFEDVVAGYQRAGAESFFLYDYTDILSWGHALPGTTRASRPSRLVEAVEKGVRALERPSFQSESGYNWGLNGPGFWILSQLLWNPKLDSLDLQAEDLMEEFLDLAFEDAAEPMSTFYDLLDGDKNGDITTPDRIHRMYAALADARGATSKPDIQARVTDLASYVRYVELYRAVDLAEGDERIEAFDTMIQHVYRIRHSGMVQYRLYFYSPKFQDEWLALEDQYGIEMNPHQPPASWLDSEVTDPEADVFIAEGMANNALRPFAIAEFSNLLVKPAAFDGDPRPRATLGYLMGPQRWYVWVVEDYLPIRLEATHGIVYTDTGNLDVTLTHAATGLVSATASVPPDNLWYVLSLPTTDSGLYWLDFDDQRSGFDLIWADDQPLTKAVSERELPGFQSYWSEYFYVPYGTTEIGGYSEGIGQVLDSQGVVRADALPVKDFFTVAVPPSEQGKIWKLQGCLRTCLLLTVPPYVADLPAQLLLPEEVVVDDELDKATYHLVLPGGGTCEDGTSTSFELSLNTRPEHDVLVYLQSTRPEEARPDRRRLRFTPDDWNVSRTVTIGGVDDLLLDGDQPYRIEFSPSRSEDPRYDLTRPEAIELENCDDEQVGFVTTAPSPGHVVEGAAIGSTFSVALTAPPTAPVEILLESDDLTEGIVQPSSVVFTPEDWNQPQWVSTFGVADETDDGLQHWNVVFRFESEDPLFAQLPVSVGVAMRTLDVDP